MVSCPATRILAGWYYLHQDAPGFPKTNFDAFRPDNEDTNDRVDVQDDHYKIVREIGAASTVLLKNVHNALPLKKPRTIVLIGSDAGPGKIGPNQFSDQVWTLLLVYHGTYSWSANRAAMTGF